MTLVYILLLAIVDSLFIRNIVAAECNIIEDKSPNLQLSRYLFCDYEPSERPTIDPKNTTTVTLMIIPRMIKFEDYTHSMQVHAWLYLAWKDGHLQWNPSDFGEIDSLWVRSYQIWMPDLAIQNAASADSVHLDIPNVNCMLARKGTVTCVVPALLSTQCNADYRHWPFDRQTCHLEFSSWSYNSNEVTLRTNITHVYMIHYEPNSEWSVVSVNESIVYKKSNYMTYDESPMLIVEFVLQRAESQLWRVFGTPTLILAAMTLTTLWLDPKSNERLLLGCVTFFCHFLCMGNIHWSVPQSNAIPNILLFYQCSVILTAIALILTCVFKKIMNSKDSPPLYISSGVSIILSSKLGQILLLSILDPKASAWMEESADDNNDLVNDQTTKKSTWAYVTIILGWIAFISYLLVYVIMFAVLLHVPHLKE